MAPPLSHTLQDAGGAVTVTPRAPASATAAGSRYLTEIDAGRWHRGLKDFEHKSVLPSLVAAVLQEPRELRFYMDHLFLKEPGSRLQTGYHQDAPYFTFDCDSAFRAAVCWCPVDKVRAARVLAVRWPCAGRALTAC